jgi:hypothetical protein
LLAFAKVAVLARRNQVQLIICTALDYRADVVKVQYHLGRLPSTVLAGKAVSLKDPES